MDDTGRVGHDHDRYQRILAGHPSQAITRVPGKRQLIDLRSKEDISPIIDLWFARMYKKGVSRKIILILLMGAVGIMLFALIYGVFDIHVLHDTQPFFVDPESAVVVASALLILDFQVMAIECPVLNLAFFAQILPLLMVALTESWPTDDLIPEPSDSPPFSRISLRI